ncbi:MAG: major capsid protein, partial [Candidatus Methanomethylicaceae archaeon]
MSAYKGFSQVKLTRPQRSKFDLSHEKKLSTRMGRLTPVFLSEVMPNDSFSVNTEVMIRLAPMLAPIYHRVNCFVHFFYIPNRLLSKEWEKFITNGRLGTEENPVPPTADIGEILEEEYGYFDQGSLSDYFGIRPIPSSEYDDWYNKRINMMPYAAYYRCWYDYYRDRNYFEDNDYLPLPAGKISASGELVELFELKTRAWQHDRFTSALPWTQRGDEVLMPIEGIGDVTYRPKSSVFEVDGSIPTAANLRTLNPAGSDLIVSEDPGVSGRIENIQDVSFTNTSVSINDLRTAARLQEWLERNAVAGSRYNESIMAHFGRRTSDGRLQRAE